MSKAPDAKKAAADTAEEHPLVSGLRWIRENRGIAMGALSVAAGLSRSHVEQIVNGRINPENVANEAVRQLARVGNVRTTWLLTGQGPREPYEGDATPPGLAPERFVERDPRYQRAEAVIAYWEEVRPDRWGPEAKAAARSRALRADEDPPAKDWEEFMDRVEGAVRGKSSLGTDVRAEDEAAPPRGRRR